MGEEESASCRRCRTADETGDHLGLTLILPWVALGLRGNSKGVEGRGDGGLGRTLIWEIGQRSGSGKERRGR